jgi:hypothetical protein
LFTIKLEVTNRGRTAVSVGNPYQWTLSGPGGVNVIGQSSACASLVQLKPGASATLMPFCGGRAFQATTAGWVTMDITVGTNCHDSIAFEIGQADSSLVLYLPFDEGSGSTASDLSSYHNAGTIVGATWVPGVRGTALEFVSGSHVTIPEIAAYDVTDAVSLLAWVKTTKSPLWGRVIDKSQYQISGFDLCLTSPAWLSGPGLPRLEFFVDNTTSAVDGKTVVTDNEWHFIAGTFGNKTLRMYVDGRKEAETRSVGNVDINPNDWKLMIGGIYSSNGAQQYFGSIDEAAMYNRELSPDEVTAIFQNGMP